MAAAADKRQQVTIAVIGHVDHGKSTLTGQLLYKTGQINERTLEMTAKQAADIGKSSFKFAFLVDKTKAERNRGLSVDFHINPLATNKFAFNLIDTPGHADFFKNMITGTAMADVAIVVVGACIGEFESAAARTGSLREKISAAKTLGVEQFIVCVNKIDAVEYNFDRYTEIKKEMGKQMKKLGVHIKHVPFIPTSAYHGENINIKSSKTPWYTGGTLLDELNKLEAPKIAVDKPLRIPISNVYNISGVGTVAVGKIESGILKPGMTLRFAEVGLAGKIFSIETFHRKVGEAKAGDYVGFHIDHVKATQLTRGFVASDANKDPARRVQRFRARLYVTAGFTIHPGYMPVMHCHTSHVTCKITTFYEKSNQSKRTQEKNPKTLLDGDMAIVEIVPQKPLSLEEYAKNRQLGRFILREGKSMVGVGMVEGVEFERDA